MRTEQPERESAIAQTESGATFGPRQFVPFCMACIGWEFCASKIENLTKWIRVRMSCF